MKKTILSIATVCLLATTTLTTPSCIGSFSLSNRLLGWNKNVGNKFLNELVFFAFWVLPVYEVCGLADILVLNSIEFWSGTNPMAKGERTIKGSDGTPYLVRCDGKGYDVVSSLDGSSVRLDFDQADQSWTIEAAGERHLLLQFIDDSHVRVPMPDGTYGIVERSQEGLYAYSATVQAATCYAAR